MYTMPEPRSGWAITSIAGISAAIITCAVVVARSLARRERSTNSAESTTSSSTLPISDAWKENSGKDDRALPILWRSARRRAPPGC